MSERNQNVWEDDRKREQEEVWQYKKAKWKIFNKGRKRERREVAWDERVEYYKNQSKGILTKEKINIAAANYISPSLHHKPYLQNKLCVRACRGCVCVHVPRQCCSCCCCFSQHPQSPSASSHTLTIQIHFPQHERCPDYLQFYVCTVVLSSPNWIPEVRKRHEAQKTGAVDDVRTGGAETCHIIWLHNNKSLGLQQQQHCNYCKLI